MQDVISTTEWIALMDLSAGTVGGSLSMRKVIVITSDDS